MTIRRMIAIIFIFLLAVGGWMILGATTYMRSHDLDSRLSYQVQQLWGEAMHQNAPSFSVKIPGSERVRQIAPSANRLDIALDLEYRRKGLIWYPTYTVDFSGEYQLSNLDAVTQKILLHFPFPSTDATYDRLTVELDGKRLEIPVSPREGINHIVELAPGKNLSFKVSYRSRGLYEWHYRFDQDLGRVRGLDATMRTNFARIDFPASSLSPMEKDIQENAATLRWQADDLLTTQSLGMIMPERLNPGPLSSRMTFFAPVALLFFFVLMAAINVVFRVPIHPMHYLFVAAGFFAFHLLFAYLVDLLNIHLTFWISAVVSMSLVTFYLRAALGKQLPWKIAFAGQLFYLVLFSYSFFLEGMAGLTVTIGAILTLAVLMKVTAKTNWEEVFGKPQSKAAPIAAAPKLEDKDFDL